MNESVTKLSTVPTGKASSINWRWASQKSEESSGCRQLLLHGNRGAVMPWLPEKIHRMGTTSDGADGCRP